MSQTVDLRDIEKRVAQSYHQDGLADIALGIFLSAQGVMMLFAAQADEAWWQRQGLYLGIVMIGGVIYWAGMKYITRPRMGSVRAGPGGKARLRKTLLITIIVVAVSWALFGLVLPARSRGWWPLWLPGLDEFTVPMIFALLILIVFGLGAYFTAFNRLLIVGIIFAAALLISEALLRTAGEMIAAIPFLVGGAVVLLMGIVILVRFVQMNPIPSEIQS